jgi:hypothetical protein
LTELVDGHVELAGSDELLDKLIGDRVARLVVPGETTEDVGTPHPVLHDLARRLYEVSLDAGAGKPGQLGPAQVLVKDMAELMEESLDLAVLE